MVRTRFAPSPTGYLHIGGVRTALFNWLFTRRHGGQFILRIDDTDAERNVEAALAPILHGFRWLGIDWDEGPEVGGPHAPYFQSKRLEHYQAAARKLLDSGHAYRDYATADEIKAERETAEKEKRPFIYSRRWMAETPAQQAKFEAEGRSGVVRLKMPREGKLIIADQIRGNVEFDWAREQDHVIQRTDGTCLYHLASVVDDHDFEITHVIRAEEHLSNTPRQVFIAQSLGYPLPVYAHLPYVAEPGSKNKLSKRKLDKYLKNADFAKINQHGLTVAAAIKNTVDEYIRGQGLTWNPVKRKQVQDVVRKSVRDAISESRLPQGSPREMALAQLLADDVDQFFKAPDYLEIYEHGAVIASALGIKTSAETFNPVIVDFYEQVGYLPDAIINYLLLLGWSLDDKTEFFTRQQMIDSFSLERVNKAPASFDPKKLMAFQDHYMFELPIEPKTAGALRFLQAANVVTSPPPDGTVPKVEQILIAAGSRIKTFGDVLEYADLLTPNNPVAYDQAAVQKYLHGPKVVSLLSAFRDKISVLTTFEAGELRRAMPQLLDTILTKRGTSLPIREIGTVAFANLVDAISRQADWMSSIPFDVASVETSLKEVIEDAGIKIGDIIHPARVAITGKPVGIGLFEHMAIIGKDACLARLDRAIHEAKGGSKSLPTSAFSHYPRAIDPHVDVAPNSDISFWEGDFLLSINGRHVPGNGSLVIKWMPTPRMELNAEVDGGFELSTAQTEIMIPSEAVKFPIFLTSISLSSSNPRASVIGIHPGRLLLGRDTAVRTLTFHLTNFHAFHGIPIRSEDALSSWGGRTQLHGDEWNITIDAIREISKSLESVKRDGGYAITHVGQISKTNGEEFTLGEASEILDCLHYFFSFVRGSWTAPILLFGQLNAAEAPVFRCWEARQFSSWEPLQSWFPVLSRDCLRSLFASFYSAWCSPRKRRVLQLATYSYLQANESQSSPDRGIVSGYSAMELLASVGAADASAHGKYGDRPAIHSTIAAAIQELGVDLRIPDDLNGLRSSAALMGEGTAIDAIRHMRNTYLHPRVEDLESANEASMFAIWEAWLMALWYVELMMLRFLGYSGEYSNRTRQGRMITEKELVPWIAGTTLPVSQIGRLVKNREF